jgi:hypothetical protein
MGNAALTRLRKKPLPASSKWRGLHHKFTGDTPTHITMAEMTLMLFMLLMW